MATGLITRVCTYEAAITTPAPPSHYSRIVVTFSQNQEILVTKTEQDVGQGMALGDSGIVVTLTQEETSLFSPSRESPMGRRCGDPAYMQIRTYASTYEAPGSCSWEMDVLDSLSEEVLSNAQG